MNSGTEFSMHPKCTLIGGWPKGLNNDVFHLSHEQSPNFGQGDPFFQTLLEPKISNNHFNC